MSNIVWMCLENSLTIVVDGTEIYRIDNSNPNWNQIRALIGDGTTVPDKDTIAKIKSLASVKESVKNFTQGNIEFTDSAVFYKGVPISMNVANHARRMIAAEEDVTPLLNFIENLMQNPSNCMDDLYEFLEYGEMPITNDGCFLAYKRVNDDYTSVHDRKTMNNLFSTMTEETLKKLPFTHNGVVTRVENGVTIVEMERRFVNHNRNETCSSGLHFCSLEYLKSFTGERIILLKINPKDVVSIPSDYNNTKGRACKYEVIGELDKDTIRSILSGGKNLEISPVVPLTDEEIYNLGYSLGRKKAEVKKQYENDENFKRGYKHGKNHKAKKF